MKIIALRGWANKGKTGTLNLLYDDIINNLGGLSTNKQDIYHNGHKRLDDFEDVVKFKGVDVAFYTDGDFSRDTIDAINKYDAMKVDVLILASNKSKKNPIKKIMTFPNRQLIEKTVGSSNADFPIANQKDASDILSYI